MSCNALVRLMVMHWCRFPVTHTGCDWVRHGLDELQGYASLSVCCHVCNGFLAAVFSVLAPLAAFKLHIGDLQL